MDKTYNPSDIETKLYQTWESKGFFKPTGNGDSYCVMIPPPNVTGSLHMGHAFQHTLQDVVKTYGLEKGKWADFIILDKDLMKASPAELLKINTLSTYINGVKVHAAAQ